MTSPPFAFRVHAGIVRRIPGLFLAHHQILGWQPINAGFADESFPLPSKSVHVATPNS
jgi:hypothetical protein